MDTAEIRRKLWVFAFAVGGMTGFIFTCFLLHVSVWWGLAAVPPGVGILILEHQASTGNKEAGIALRSLVSLTLVGAAFIWFPMIIMVVGNAVFHIVPGHYWNWIAVAVWPIGWAAFRLKQFNQIYYGAVEIVAGVITAFGTTVKGQWGPTQGLAVLGAMYVVSRGYGNIADGTRKKDEIERNAQAFSAYRGRVKIASAKLWRVILRKD
jgi:hypothetical protein